MPNTAPTPEETAEQTANHVLKRWNKLGMRFLYPIVLFMLISFSVLIILICNITPHPIMVLLTLISFIGSFNTFSTQSKSFRSFAQRLSEEEKAALRVTAQGSSIREAESASRILQFSGETVPEKEYVRASSQPEQPDTLLRAAQPSAETAQEQLLRPTQE